MLVSDEGESDKFLDKNPLHFDTANCPSYIITLTDFKCNLIS